jgi:hypothetical protein
MKASIKAKMEIKAGGKRKYGYFQSPRDAVKKNKKKKEAFRARGMIMCWFEWLLLLSFTNFECS